MGDGLFGDCVTAGCAWAARFWVCTCVFYLSVTALYCHCKLLFTMLLFSFFTVLHRVGKAKAWRRAEYNGKALVHLALELQTHYRPPWRFAVPSIAAVPASSSCDATSSFLSFLLASLPPWCVPEGFSAVEPSSLHFRCGSLAPSPTQNVQTCNSDKAMVLRRWQFLFCTTLDEQ